MQSTWVWVLLNTEFDQFATDFRCFESWVETYHQQGMGLRTGGPGPCCLCLRAEPSEIFLPGWLPGFWVTGEFLLFSSPSAFLYLQEISIVLSSLPSEGRLPSVTGVAQNVSEFLSDPLLVPRGFGFCLHGVSHCFPTPPPDLGD